MRRTDQTIPSLWKYYDEHASQARQHENLRATATTILSGIAAAVVGLAGLGGLDRADIPAGLVVVLLALLGVALSLKHYERNRLHTDILDAVRDEIDRLDEDDAATPHCTKQIRREAVQEHNTSFTVLKGSKRKGNFASPWTKVRLHLLWLGLPSAVGVVGALLVILAFVGVDPG